MITSRIELAALFVSQDFHAYGYVTEDRVRKALKAADLFAALVEKVEAEERNPPPPPPAPLGAPLVRVPGQHVGTPQQPGAQQPRIAPPPPAPQVASSTVEELHPRG